jgi:leukotriene-A4 hydrolase
MGTVAHELAHSWSGNLVTNASWDDIWISEGITSYLTRRLEEMVFGKRSAELSLWHDWQRLSGGIESLKPADQILHPASKGRDPDDMLGPIPYQKGALFLRSMEATEGRPKMDRFLRHYFARFAYESIPTDDAIAYMKFMGLHPPQEWLEQPGLPKSAAIPKLDPLTSIAKAKSTWSRNARIRTEAWTTPEWLHFLSLLEPNEYPRADKQFHFSQSPSRPILASWLKHAAAANFAPAMAQVDAFAASPADTHTLVEIYTELAKTPSGMSRARMLFETNRSAYPDVLARQIMQLVNP